MGTQEPTGSRGPTGTQGPDDTIEALTARVQDALDDATAPAGDRGTAGDALYLDWTTLRGVLTAKREALLRHLHAEPAPSLRALARALGRDYKRVHEDVAALAAAGLIRRDGTALRAACDRIRTVVSL